jgi:branched-chain amino acid transport system substrate-binding protein
MLAQLAPKARTAGIVSRDNGFDEAASKRTADLLRQAGLEVVLDQQYSERLPNFYNILTLIESRDPDVLLWTGHDGGAVDFIRLAKARGIAPRLLASFAASVTSPGFRTALGRDADYAFGVTPWLPTERLKDRWLGDGLAFASEYESRFGGPPDYRAAAAVAAVEAFAMALEKAGTLEPKAVRDALAQVDFESLYGRVRFGADGQIALPQRVVQVQDGRLIEVFTDRLVHTPVYPVPPWEKRS